MVARMATAANASQIVQMALDDALHHAEAEHLVLCLVGSYSPPMRRVHILFIGACALACAKTHPPLLGDPDATAEGQSADAARSMPGIEGRLVAKNSAGRTGSFYLPAGFDAQAVPMLVAYHGTGGEGSHMVAFFRSAAASRGFIIVAPDSRISPDGLLTWQVGDHANDITEDYTHTLDCIAEVRGKPGVQVDERRVLAAGYSGGGSSAPYIATNERLFKAFAVLHGGVIAGNIGSNVIRGWFSTGESDPVRPPSGVKQSADYMTSLGFADITFKTYPGGHEPTSAEAGDVVAWWLGN